jgi:hypothetical protein
MKNKELYDKTISILVKAYLNDTLQQGSCYACAVGNMIAANCGIKMIDKKWDKSPNTYWDSVFSSYRGVQEIDKYAYCAEAKKELDSTGYIWKDLAKIEKAFESTRFNEEGRQRENAMYEGLLAVVEVLGQIHEVEKEVIEETKLMFVK